MGGGRGGRAHADRARDWAAGRGGCFRHLPRGPGDAGAIRFELIPLDAAGEGRGLASLPLPSPGDVFLDLEADIFVGEGGLEYLFGLLLVEDGRPVYREVWAHSLEDEKAAFCSFMDLVAERRRRWPEMHVYHYGGYEAGGLKRLMGRHAVREDALDGL